MSTYLLTDTQFALADRIETALEDRPESDFSASQVARLVKAETAETRTVLDWMVDHVMVTPTGRGGAWRRYQARIK